MSNTILGIPIIIVLSIVVIDWICEYMDSSLGGGYGTLMTPILLLFGFSLPQIVPAILVSELVSGTWGGYFHHRFNNVSFNLRSPHLKVVICLITTSIVGSIVGVYGMKFIPKYYVKLYIGILVVLIGLSILIFRNKQFKFSWLKIGSLGTIAAFNKGLMGGGYGPLIAGGQLVSGIESKNAVGITTLSEGLVCILGFILYLINFPNLDLRLAPILIISSFIVAPIAAYGVKHIPSMRLKMLMGILTILLGSYTLYNLFMGAK